MKQLENLSAATYELGKRLLVEQALFMAIYEQISWKRTGEDTFEATALLGLPGQEPLPTKIFFHADNGALDPPVTMYFFSLEGKNGPSRNSADALVKELAKKFFVS
jgi:hypothetical protein